MKTSLTFLSIFCILLSSCDKNDIIHKRGLIIFNEYFSSCEEYIKYKNWFEENEPDILEISNLFDEKNKDNNLSFNDWYSNKPIFCEDIRGFRFYVSELKIDGCEGNNNLVSTKTKTFIFSDDKKDNFHKIQYSVNPSSYNELFGIFSFHIIDGLESFIDSKGVEKPNAEIYLNYILFNKPCSVIVELQAEDGSLINDHALFSAI